MKYSSNSRSRFTLGCILISLLSPMLALYLHIHNQNQLTEMRREIPALQRQVKKIQEENRSLQYVKDSFESPLHLMEMARRPEYSHLKYPYLNEVIILHEEAGGVEHAQ